MNKDCTPETNTASTPLKNTSRHRRNATEYEAGVGWKVAKRTRASVQIHNDNSTFGSFSWAMSQDNEILCFSLPLANGQEQQITLSFEKQLPWLLTALQSAFFLHTETQLANRHISALHLPSQIPQASSLGLVLSAMVPRMWCSLWHHSFWEQISSEVLVYWWKHSSISGRNLREMDLAWRNGGHQRSLRAAWQLPAHTGALGSSEGSKGSAAGVHLPQIHSLIGNPLQEHAG